MFNTYIKLAPAGTQAPLCGQIDAGTLLRSTATSLGNQFEYCSILIGAFR